MGASGDDLGPEAFARLRLGGETMSAWTIRRRLSRLEERAPETESGSYTLEEICRAQWRRNRDEYLESASGLFAMRYFIPQFEYEDSQLNHENNR